MKLKLVAITFLLSLTICAGSQFSTIKASNIIPPQQVSFSNNITDQIEEEGFQKRSLALREKLATQDLNELDDWWQRINLGDPHKYLLPVILSRLSLPEKYQPKPNWEILLNMDKYIPNPYHFRSIYDIRIFFLFRDILPPEVKASYRRMLDSRSVEQWNQQGTENHMFMQRLSGLALMDGSGWKNPLPATAATNEAWLRAEINKFLTIGQGEFHSSTYYGYSISGLLNLYDFAQTQELRELAKAALDYYAANMAIRFSWGTAGGAESRGFDRGTWDGSGLSALAWLWWGSDPTIVQRIDSKRLRVALLAALSDYRPPQEFKALALKQVSLPFVLRASHPAYYSYHKANQFFEKLYVTPDYSLGTLLIPRRSYQVKGTINAQYATYKLIIRDPKEVSNAVVSLGGTFHNPMATGNSPGDQYLQEKGTVIYQLRLNKQDIQAKVPPRSHLVLPSTYGQPKRYKNWYIWQIEQTWLCASVWGDKISWQPQVSAKNKNKDYQVLISTGNNTAWITDVFSTNKYGNFQALKQALDKNEINDQDWEKEGKLSYKTTEGKLLTMAYESNKGIASAKINGEKQLLDNWPVLDSPYLKEDLNSGILELVYPEAKWHLQGTLTGPKWD